jgi:transcriptional regulator with XRE-family HTH domain
MKLSEKIKQLRNSANLTQPELAQAAGIEQSYLSKLENDKGSPSFEVIRKLAAALSMDAMKLIESLDESYIKENLAHIPEVAAKSAEVRLAKEQQQKRLYIQAAFMIVFGIAAVFLGVTKTVFSNYSYEYYSFGVLKAGEPLGQFTLRHLSVIGETHQEKEKRLINNRERIDEDHMMTSEYLGEQFVKDVADGRRIYRLEEKVAATHHYNDLVLVLGIIFIMLGGFTMHYVYRFKS